MEFFLLNTFKSDEKEGFQIGTSILIGLWTPDYEWFISSGTHVKWAMLSLSN